MANATVRELQRAGIEFDSYRELAQPSTHGQAAARWPLLAVTDQVLLAERWKRDTLAASVQLPRNVTPLAPARPSPIQTDWFHAGAPVTAGPAVVASKPHA
ncbi:MAG: hypothetical protein U1F43_06590 [Myxococcota bacterium]